ncbi:unnamed protein product [Trichogramma brassicae]|uniref:Uncharacterized protein n=1 Tax=Trichogramma brassicae TaxID=86971 RepID=A0A6H5IZG5_9HYME|nr:unnamed protein product [Trichogramma brassicae]
MGGLLNSAAKAPLVDLLIETGYKDEPDVDQDGKPLWLRNTAVHTVREINIKYESAVRKLFKIYDRFDVNYTNDCGDTHFHVACKYGLEDVVEKFLELGQDPNLFENCDSESPLTLAVRSGHKDVALLLLRNGADPNSANEKGWTIMHFLCKEYYDVEPLKMLFEICDESNQPLQVDAKDKFGRTPLQWAVARLLPNTVEVLLDRGADLSGFVFPAESDFGSNVYGLYKSKSGALLIAEHLKKRGYELDRSDALTVMNFFAKNGLSDKSSNLEEFSNDHEEKFESMLKNIEIRPSLTLYELFRMRSDEAAKLVTAADYYELACSGKLRELIDEYRKACDLRLCDITSRRFCRRWALNSFLELTRYRLPILCCELIIDHSLTNGDLFNICLAAEGQSHEDSKKIPTPSLSCVFARVASAVARSNDTIDIIVGRYSQYTLRHRGVNIKRFSRRVFFSARARDRCNMAQDDRACSRKLKSLRQGVDWENEAQRDDLYEQLYELIRDWEGRYPDLRDVFRPEEIDWLLMESVRSENREMDAEPLVDFVVRCGYKDEAATADDGNARRTTALHYAIGYRFLCVVRGLFQIYDRYDVNYVDEESGLTHFHAACVAGYEAAVRRFLELGRVDPNCRPAGAAAAADDPPLHLALTHHRREVTKLLLKHGADPNLANAKGSTALHVMCEEHVDYDLADILFDFGGDHECGPVLVDARDREGNAPLHLALRHGHRNLTKLLLARGADPNIVNEAGETPLHVNCQRYRDDDLAELFFKVNDEIERTQVVRVNVEDKLGPSSFPPRVNFARGSSRASTRPSSISNSVWPWALCWSSGISSAEDTPWTRRRPDDHASLRELRIVREVVGGSRGTMARRRGVRENGQKADDTSESVAVRADPAASRGGRQADYLQGLPQGRALAEAVVPAAQAHRRLRPAPVREGVERIFPAMGVGSVAEADGPSVADSLLRENHQAIDESRFVAYLLGRCESRFVTNHYDFCINYINSEIYCFLFFCFQMNIETNDRRTAHVHDI